jgi:hypothetical protein
MHCSAEDFEEVLLQAGVVHMIVCETPLEQKYIVYKSREHIPDISFKYVHCRHLAHF